MSRAFVKEPDADLPQDDEPLHADSPHPPYITTDGVDLLTRQLAKLRADFAAADDSGELGRQTQKKRLRRDIRVLERKLARSIVVDPGKQPTDRVSIGHWVMVEDDDGASARYRIVGEDQADLPKGWISWVSPLGKALIGAEIGVRVTWIRPVGMIGLTVTDIQSEVVLKPAVHP